MATKSKNNLDHESKENDQDENNENSKENEEKQPKNLFDKQMERIQKARLNSRMLDNHWDPNLHDDNHFLPAGHLKDYKYGYSDSGLYYRIEYGDKFMLLKNKLSEVEERREMQKKAQSMTKSQKEKNIEEKLQNDKRKIKELSSLKDGEIIMVIEHCTNCEHHQNSTRHDAAKYKAYADNVKKEVLKNFPVIRVVTKPLIFDPSDRSKETMEKASMIGCFEIKIFSHSKSSLLFSKLNTKTWPNIPKILEKLRDFVPVCNILIRIIDEEHKGQEENESLMGVSVFLTPLRELQKRQETEVQSNCISRPMTGHSKITKIIVGGRPDSTKRPASSLSCRTTKSVQQLGKLTKEEKFSICVNTNENGEAMFTSIPLDTYQIEIENNKDYPGRKQELNLFKMIEDNNVNDGTFVIDIKLERHSLSYCTIEVVSSNIPIPGVHGEIFSLDEKNEEPQIGILKENPPKSGKFVLSLDPGEYCIRLKKEGFVNFESNYTLKRGGNSLICELVDDPNYEQPQAISPKVQIQTLRPHQPDNSKIKKNNRPYSGASGKRQQSGTDNSKKRYASSTGISKDATVPENHVLKLKVMDAMEGIPIDKVQIIFKMKDRVERAETNSVGETSIITDHLTEGFMILKADGYIKIKEEFGGNAGFIPSHYGDLAIPIMKRPTNPDSFSMYLTTRANEKVIEFVVITPDNEMIEEDGKKNAQIEFKSYPQSGGKMLTISNFRKIEGVYRIFAKIVNKSLFHPNEMRFSIYQINDKHPTMLNIPKMKNPQHLIWDIGFIHGDSNLKNHTQFIEINALTNELKSASSRLDALQELLLFLRFTKSSREKILGFDKGESYQNDRFVDLKSILNNLEKNGFEKIDEIGYFIGSCEYDSDSISFQILKKKFLDLEPPYSFCTPLAQTKSYYNRELEKYDKYLQQLRNINFLKKQIKI